MRPKKREVHQQQTNEEASTATSRTQQVAQPTNNNNAKRSSTGNIRWREMTVFSMVIVFFLFHRGGSRQNTTISMEQKSPLTSENNPLDPPKNITTDVVVVAKGGGTTASGRKFSPKYMLGKDQNIDTRQDLAYLPPTKEKISENQAQFLADLDRRLHTASTRTDCNINSTMFAMLRNDGFGASFHFAHLALGRAISRDLPLILMGERPEQNWIWGNLCSSHDWNCVFEPTHSCDYESNNNLRARIQLVQREWLNEKKPCPAPWCQTWSRRSFRFDQKGPLSLGIPEDNGVSSVLYRGKLSAFLFRLNPTVMKEVNERPFIQVSLGPHPRTITKMTLGEVTTTIIAAQDKNDMSLIAMHVRQGDSCKDPRKIRKCFQLHEYMDGGATKMKRLYGSNTIVLATDSAEVVETAITNYTEWNWIIQDIDRAKYDVKDEQAYQKGEHIPGRMKSNKLDTRNITMETITDLTALSRASLFVGAFTSDFGRLAFELIAAHTSDYVPPFVSLAGTFCAGDEPITKRVVYLCE